MVKKLNQYKNGYKLLTEYFGIPRQDDRDHISIVVYFFGIEIDINLFIIQIPTKKK